MPDATAATAALAPLSEPGVQVSLLVPGAKAAQVAVPLGARAARPLVVGLHGNFDRPEWSCDVWSEIATAGFVVCPRGTARTDAPKGDDRWTYSGSGAAGHEVDAALQAARDRWGAYVAEGPVVYVGFSLGAILGVPIVASAPDRFPRVVLVEGGHDGWTDARAAAFAKTSGDVAPRVLFVCAQSGCVPDTKEAVRNLARHHVETKVVSAGNVGHRYDGPVAEAVRKEWSWVTEGVPGWAE